MNNYKSTLKKVPKVLLLFYLFLISSPIISHSAALFQDKPSSESNLEIDFFCSRSINTINSHSETDNSPEDVIKPNFLIVAPCTAELENTTPTPFGDNSCGGSESTMTFNITDNLTISDLNVGLNISVLTHRHHFQVVLTSPMGTSATLVTAPQSANFADNIDITLDDSSSDPILDIDDDDLTAPFYDRLAMPDNPLSVFNGENAMGNWTMTICDDNSADSAIGGTLNQAQLFFEGDCPSSNTNPADYLISTLNGQTTNTCTGIFADSGDTNSNYSDNEILTTTFCSDANNHISFTFNHFNTEAGSDILNIYDGTSTGATLLGAYSGFGEANSPGVITSSDLCLTFEFTSSASTTSVGWLASIKCTGSPVPTSTGSSWAGYPEGSTCSTEIGGIVYEDLDQDGQRDSDDSPISGVTVTLFDDNGQVGSPMLSDVNGAYLFSGLDPTTVYRVEFTAYGGFEEGPQGSNNNTDIQFVDGGSCDVDFSVVDPRHYCGDGNPFWTIPCYNNGDPQDPTNILATGIARFEYTDSGDSPAPSYMNYVSFGSVGTIWGTSFSHANNTGYYGTLLKRHAGIGPDGIGAIYMHVDGTPNTSAPLFYDFGSTAGVVDNNMVRFPGTGTGFGQEGACGMCDNVDPTTFGQIGKVGFGDLDLGPDGDFLYVTNLADRKIYKISTQNPAPGSATPLPGIPWLDNSICNDGVARPWALEWRRGKLYVGVMCDASLSACAIGAACPDLTANVFSFDGTTWTQEISFPMDYYREAYAAGSDYPVKWIDNWSAMAPFVNNVTDANFLQPILMDIEFDDDNNMIIGIGDRSGFQMGYRSANPTANADDDSERNFAFGDVLKTCYDPVSDTYTLENNGSVCGNTTTNPTNDTGPGGKSFYWGDYWTGIGANKYQAGIGSLAYLPCSDEIMFPIGDAIDYYSNGVIWIDNTDGSANNKIEIYQGSPNGNAPNFAKSSGVGDIEFMDTTPGPLEIGNIVWWDENNNGLQDPSESGIDAVALELWKDDGSGTFVKVAETTTDAYGRYIFSSSSNANGLNAETWTFTADDNVLPFSNYEIRIPSWNTDTGIINFRNTLGYTGHLISPTMNQGANGIERDNNGADVSSDVVTSLTTGGPSQNDHSYDFAFSGVGGCDKPRVVVNANTPCEGEDIVFSTSVTGGETPYMYTWTGPNGFSATTQSPTIMAADTLLHKGFYTLVVTDNLGCSEEVCVDLHINILSATCTATDATCGVSDGTIDLTVDGLQNYTFVWSNAATTEDLTGLAAGSYTVTITDANGCTHEKTASVNSTGSATLAETHMDATCGNDNGSIDLTIAGTSNSISWTGPNGFTSTSEDISSLESGTYNVTVNNVANCPASLSIIIGDSSPPTASSIPNNSVCGGMNGSISLSISGGTGPFTYNWSNGTTTEGLSGLSASLIPYAVTITDANNCTATTSGIISDTPGPTLNLSSTDEICGLTNGSIDLSVVDGTGPFTFLWSNGMTTEDISGLAAGDYSVTITDTNGCINSGNTTINNSSGPSIIAVPVGANGCISPTGSATLTVSGGTGVITYLWSNGATTQNLTGVMPGAYSVVATDANGCEANTSVFIDNLDAPSITTTVIDPTTCLESGSVDIEVTGGVEPFTFAWSNGATTEDLNDLEGGVYQVTITDANGCNYIDNASIRVIRPPAISVVETPPTCGASDGAIDVSFSDPDGMGPYIYNWSNGATTEDLSGLASGIYTLTVTNAISCDGVITVNLNSIGAPIITSQYIVPQCGASDGSIDISVSGGVSPYIYNWSNGETTEDISGLASGVYDVEVTDASGCITVISVNLTSISDFPVYAGPNVTICEGDSTSLSALGGVSYTWSPNTGLSADNIADPVATPMVTTVYTLTATDADGCTDTDEVEVTVIECDYPVDPAVCLDSVPCHIVSSDIYLGSGSTGDITSGAASDDNEGVSFPNNLHPNNTINLPVTIFNNTGNDAYLTGWIDWNGDGDFDDLGEQIANETYTTSGSFTEYISVTIPTNAVQDLAISAIWRLSTDALSIDGPCGNNGFCTIDGEVEIYSIVIICLVPICEPATININRSND